MTEASDQQSPLSAGEQLDQDNMQADPLEGGAEPPEGWSGADRHGMTQAEQAEGEPLDERLRQERPDVGAGDTGQPDQFGAGETGPGGPDQFGAGETGPGGPDQVGAGGTGPGGPDQLGAGETGPGGPDQFGAGETGPGGPDQFGAGGTGPGGPDQFGAGETGPGGPDQFGAGKTGAGEPGFGGAGEPDQFDAGGAGPLGDDEVSQGREDEMPRMTDSPADNADRAGGGEDNPIRGLAPTSRRTSQRRHLSSQVPPLAAVAGFACGPTPDTVAWS